MERITKHDSMRMSKSEVARRRNNQVVIDGRRWKIIHTWQEEEEMDGGRNCRVILTRSG